MERGCLVMTAEDPKSSVELGINGVRPVGKLAEMLENFQAPGDVQKCLAKRIGALVGIRISYERVQQTIIDGLTPDGFPDWQKITDCLGEAANRVYRGRNPFSKT